MAEQSSLSKADMAAARRLIERLIEWEPNSPLNADRRNVLDNWPSIAPVLSTSATSAGEERRSL
jgi:hypothetical protein